MAVTTPGSSPGTSTESLVRRASLGLPAGPAGRTFTIVAPAQMAYDVRIAAPAQSVLHLATHVAPGTVWTVATTDRLSCRTSSGKTACLWHFAKGGNPGGTWTAVVRKHSGSSARVDISFFFLKQPPTQGPTH